MSSDRSPRWLPAALLLGVAYLIVGRVFAVPGEHAHLWRLAAWGVSGILFAAHIAYEHFALRSTPRVAAVHVALAVAIGAGGLALAGMVRSLSGGSGVRPAWALALILWPAITALPAFLVAVVAGTALGRIKR
jgi:hypothetical protein